MSKEIYAGTWTTPLQDGGDSHHNLWAADDLRVRCFVQRRSLTGCLQATLNWYTKHAEFGFTFKTTHNKPRALSRADQNRPWLKTLPPYFWTTLLRYESLDRRGLS